MIMSANLHLTNTRCCTTARGTRQGEMHMVKQRRAMWQAVCCKAAPLSAQRVQPGMQAQQSCQDVICHTTAPLGMVACPCRLPAPTSKHTAYTHTAPCAPSAVLLVAAQLSDLEALNIFMLPASEQPHASGRPPPGIYASCLSRLLLSRCSQTCPTAAATQRTQL